MDANRLIAEVYKRPALWNQRHISYHNREVTNRVWMEIAAIFNLPSTCFFHHRVLESVISERNAVCSHARRDAPPRRPRPSPMRRLIRATVLSFRKDKSDSCDMTGIVILSLTKIRLKCRIRINNGFFSGFTKILSGNSITQYLSI